MEDIKVTEEPEKQIVWVTTNKRKNKIKIFVHPMDGFGFWRVGYEDGRPIPEIGGRFLSKNEALKEVKKWLIQVKQSKEAKQYELFGDKQPPELKRKQVRARASTTDIS